MNNTTVSQLLQRKEAENQIISPVHQKDPTCDRIFSFWNQYSAIYINVKQGSGPNRDEVLYNGEKFRPSVHLSIHPPRGLSQAQGGPSQAQGGPSQALEGQIQALEGPSQAVGGQSQVMEGLSQTQESLSQALGGLC